MRLELIKIVNTRSSALRELAEEAHYIVRVAAQHTETILAREGVREDILRLDLHGLGEVLADAVRKPSVRESVISTVRVVERRVRQSIRRVLQPYQLVQAMRNILDTSSRLFHLSYLVTEDLEARDLAVLLYALSRAVELNRETAFLHVLTSSILMLRGERDRALALLALGIWDKLPVKPDEKPSSIKQLKAVMMLNYLSAIASDVDGELLYTWRFYDLLPQARLEAWG